MIRSQAFILVPSKGLCVTWVRRKIEGNSWAWRSRSLVDLIFLVRILFISRLFHLLIVALWASSFCTIKNKNEKKGRGFINNNIRRGFSKFYKNPKFSRQLFVILSNSCDPSEGFSLGSHELPQFELDRFSRFYVYLIQTDRQ